MFYKVYQDEEGEKREASPFSHSRMTMRYEFIVFIVITIIFYIASLFSVNSIGFGYWVIAFLAYNFLLAIVGFILKKEFFAGAIGNLEHNEKNKSIRRTAFFSSLGMLIGILFLLYKLYFEVKGDASI